MSRVGTGSKSGSMDWMKDGRTIMRCKRPARRRAFLFHLVAVLVVLSPLAMVEIIARLCVPAPPVNPEDPYVSFTGLRPLFVLDSTGMCFETAKERFAAFRRQSFAAAKGPQTFRIFCLGGSTVQGHPYSVETSFPTWLTLSLRAARPATEWEIVNCGGVSYASYRLVPLMQELLQHAPDLFILCTGHNEFLEDRSYGRLKTTPRALIRLHRAMLHLRTYSLADHWLSRKRGRHSARTALSQDVQTKLDMEHGLESYRRDEVWRQGTIEHFRRNVETMVQMAHAAGVPIILMNPVSNLKDCPPFRSEFQVSLSETQRRDVADLMERAARLDWADAYGKIRFLEQAVAIDDRHAGLLYRIGMCYHRLGRFAEARTWFLRAKEEDVCPLRMLEPMREIVLDCANRHDVPLVDMRSLIEQQTADGIPGDEWLLDHVHPSIEGHQLVADRLYQTMEEMGFVRTPDGWLAERDTLRQDHLASLNQAYYAHGQEHLRRLRRWSRGPNASEQTSP